MGKPFYINFDLKLVFFCFQATKNKKESSTISVQWSLQSKDF